jgi:16S rRNA (guanine1516-N2)-methyltransferase
MEADAMKVLEETLNSDVIYFDPMFEDANAKSLPKKEMRIFRELIKQDLDAEKVLQKALGAGVKRVVVKRPRLSRALTEKMALEFTGKATRYDVYFPFEANPLK